MKHFLLTISLIIFISVAIFPQAIVFQDDFEAYVVGTQLTVQNPVDWTTWSSTPGSAEDPLVSSDVAYSGTNSIIITSSPGPRDLVHPIANYTTGRYKISFRMYIPSGFDGYFNTLQEFLGPSTVNWGMQVYFYAGGTGNMDAGGALIQPFTFTHNTWMLVEVIVDHDIDWAEFWLDGVLLHGWQWSLGTFGTPQINQLGGSNLYGHDDPSTVEPAQFYFDDYQLWDMLVPVELTSFTANVTNQGDVVLNWATATETNNQMFEVERKAVNGEFYKIGYVNGAGTTTEPQQYSYTDNAVGTGIYYYRLKQIDFNGTYEYFNEIEVDVKGPLTFALGQNYPNPFNPSTKINYSLPEAGYVKLAVYNLVGEEVAVLIDGETEAGFYEVTFDASSMPSGAYFYKLQSQNTVEVKKMLLTK